jgi:DNA-binding response OmpR family regulator
MEKIIKRTVLVIEFDPVLSDLICLALQRNGYSVLPLQKPESIIGNVQQERPAWIIIDLFLPGIDAQKLLRSIKSTLADEGKIIVLSSMGFGEVINTAKENGADIFITKPFDIDALVEIIRGSGDKE